LSAQRLDLLNFRLQSIPLISGDSQLLLHALSHTLAHLGGIEIAAPAATSASALPGILGDNRNSPHARDKQRQ
jgi:hypothetical protein